MAGKRQIKYPPNDVLAERVLVGGVVAVAEELGISAGGLRAHLVREGLPTKRGQVERRDGTRTFTLDNLPEGAAWTPEALLEAVGLRPEEWRITSVKARGGHWGDPEAPSSQVRLEVSVAPIDPPFTLPTLEGWTPLPPPKPRKRKAAEPETALVIGDHHAPHHDQTFHALLCRWLADDQPDLIEVNGDLMDFGGDSVSRHRAMPARGPGGPAKFNNTPNECLQAAFNILADYRTACPNARIRLKFGNHDYRLYYALVDNLKGLYDITAAGEDTPALSLRNLLHLDDLHVELVEKEWQHARTRVGKRLTVLHGYSTTKNPGGKMLTELTGSTLQGHSHRLSLIYRTSHHPDEGPETRLAGECGCACEIDEGLGYANSPDWQQGAMLVKTWRPSGDFTVAPIVYLPGRLLIPDGRRYV